MRKYRLIAKKGEGTFSEVLKAQSVKNGKCYAIKCMKTHFSNIEQVNNLREIQALRRLSPHPNIVQLEEVLYDKPTGRLALVFELMDMNLYELIRGRRHYLDPQLVKIYMFQLLRSLAHMHKKGVFHRDLKPENILIENNYDVHTGLKLADFGSCRGVYSKQPYTEYISTRWYRAPECLLTDGYYGAEMDVWGVGCVMFEISCLYPLVPGNNELDQVKRIHSVFGTPDKKTLAFFKSRASAHIDLNFSPVKGSGIRKLAPHLSENTLDLLTGLLQYDPRKRISAQDALDHPYFAELRKVPEPEHLFSGKTASTGGSTHQRPSSDSTGGVSLASKFKKPQRDPSKKVENGLGAVSPLPSPSHRTKRGAAKDAEEPAKAAPVRPKPVKAKPVKAATGSSSPKSVSSEQEVKEAESAAGSGSKKPAITPMKTRRSTPPDTIRSLNESKTSVSSEHKKSKHKKHKKHKRRKEGKFRDSTDLEGSFASYDGDDTPSPDLSGSFPHHSGMEAKVKTGMQSSYKQHSQAAAARHAEHKSHSNYDDDSDGSYDGGHERHRKRRHHKSKHHHHHHSKKAHGTSGGSKWDTETSLPAIGGNTNRSRKSNMETAESLPPIAANGITARSYEPGGAHYKDSSHHKHKSATQQYGGGKYHHSKYGQSSYSPRSHHTNTSVKSSGYGHHGSFAGGAKRSMPHHHNTSTTARSKHSTFSDYASKASGAGTYKYRRNKQVKSKYASLFSGARKHSHASHSTHANHSQHTGGHSGHSGGLGLGGKYTTGGGFNARAGGLNPSVKKHRTNTHRSGMPDYHRRY